MENPPEGLGDAFRTVMRPPPFPIPATPRVAVLCPEGGDIGQTIRDAGLEVVHSHKPETGGDHLDFDRIPPFDLVVTTLPDAPSDRGRALELTFRFLYIRRPASFVLVGKGQEPDVELARFVRSKTQRMGYQVKGGSAGGRSFTVGTMGGMGVFVWPPGVVPRRRRKQSAGENNEGSDEGPLTVIQELRRPPGSLDMGSPELATRAVMGKVAEWLRR